MANTKEDDALPLLNTNNNSSSGTSTPAALDEAAAQTTQQTAVSAPPAKKIKCQTWLVLGLFLVMYVLNQIDRQLVPALGVNVQKDLEVRNNFFLSHSM